MTTPSDEQQRWQQPSWEPTGTDSHRTSEPDGVADPVSGQVLVPATPARPPSLVESTLNVINGLVWPMAIVGAIFGFGGGWLINLAVAFLISAGLGGISTELRRRRRSR